MHKNVAQCQSYHSVQTGQVKILVGFSLVWLFVICLCGAGLGFYCFGFGWFFWVFFCLVFCCCCFLGGFVSLFGSFWGAVFGFLFFGFFCKVIVYFLFCSCKIFQSTER